MVMIHETLSRAVAAGQTSLLEVRKLRCRMSRLLSSSASAAPKGASFSDSWRNVDDSREDSSDVRAPDPVAYLKGFDAVPEVRSYKESLLKACDLRPGDGMLDVGCGTGTHIPAYAELVGAQGKIHAVDISQDIIGQAQERFKHLRNVEFEVADIYSLSVDSKTYDVVKEDRVLQHLARPLEAVQEMLRITKPGGLVVLSNPDFRSFQFDAMEPIYSGEKRRAPDHLNFDMALMTTKVLNGVIPTLSCHPSIGISQAKLLHHAGANNVEVHILPIPLLGRENMEAIVPFSYMARLSSKNGAISEREMNLWLEKLEWEEQESSTGLFGVLNFYICRGVKPDSDGLMQRSRQTMGTKVFPKLNQNKPKHDAKVRFLTKNDSDNLIEDATNLINNEYAQVDTGITLSSRRVRHEDIQHMVDSRELMVCQDEITGELLGCIQVLTKDSAGTSSGLPDFGDNAARERIGEFTCLAVRSDKIMTVTNANTQQICVTSTQNNGPGANKRGRGIGASLVRAAEAHCRQHGCKRMQLGIISPAAAIPEYKKWLQSYYLSLGYVYRSTLELEFEVDESGTVVADQLHEMYDVLHQLVPCKAILFDKSL